MSEFWLWFWRPIAEMIGGIALIFGIFLLIVGWVIGSAILKSIQAKFRSGK